ncbi:hypothetical protein F9K33_00460 [bacterium]|nr:MAG: hypothetical protein F9K33_00460 [bacterium]
MISIERCKEILNRGERKYSDEEIQKLREQYYKLAAIEIELLKHGMLNDLRPQLCLQPKEI